MNTLNIEKFSPTVAELNAMVGQYKDLTIAGIEDQHGYILVDAARKQLKRARIQIEKDGKYLRSEALAFQKMVIAKERELISLIEPTEKELEEKQRTIDEEKEMIKRQKFLPERKAKLSEIGVTIEDGFLLLLDDVKWQEFFNQKHSEYLQEQGKKALEEKRKVEAELLAEQKRLDEEKRKIDEEKKELEREKQKQIEIEAAKKSEAERVKKEIEQKTRDEQEKKIREEAEKVAKEKAEREKLEKKAKYQKFLQKNNYYAGDDFYVFRDGSRFVLYRKIDEITL